MADDAPKPDATPRDRTRNNKSRREKARMLFVRQGYTMKEIAAELGVNGRTVYAWRDTDRSHGHDWEDDQRIYNLAPRELVGVLVEGLKKFVLDLRDNPERYGDPRTADAISKYMSALKNIDVRAQYRGVALDLIKVVNTYLADADPALQKQMAEHWDGIKLALIEYSSGQGLPL